MQDISKTVPSYSIEFERKTDYDELLLQFNRIRRTAYYQHNKHYNETLILRHWIHLSTFLMIAKYQQESRLELPKRFLIYH